MRVLNIYPTYSCPFKCKFCYNLNKCDDRTLLDINYVDEFLSKHYKNFNKVIISGGESTLLPNTYMNNLIEVIKKYFNNIELSSYPIATEYYPDITYNFSYDFIARPRADVAWKNLLNFNKPFIITTTLSPLMFRVAPYKILTTFKLLKYIRKVIIKPYYCSKNSYLDIKKTEYQKFINSINASKNMFDFEVVYGEFNDEFILRPDGKLCITQFDNNIRCEKEISVKDIKNYSTNYPENVLL